MPEQHLSTTVAGDRPEDPAALVVPGTVPPSHPGADLPAYRGSDVPLLASRLAPPTSAGPLLLRPAC